MSNHESGRRIHAGRFAPPDDLADIVDCFWEGAWDLRVSVRGLPPIVVAGVAAGTRDLVVRAVDGYRRSALFTGETEPPPAADP